MVALIVIGSIMTYLVVAGATMVNFTSWRERECPSCAYGRRCTSDHKASGFFAGLLFPLALPLIVGTTVVPNFADADRQPRAERRRQKEMEEAEHRVQLARVRAQETEALERSLKSL